MMNQQRFTTLLSIYAFTLMLSRTALPGFEIGNGRQIVENKPGRYSIVVSDKMEVGQRKNYSEVIAPLADGTPRTRLQINVVKEDTVGSIEELVRSRDGAWTQTTISGLSGIQKEEILPTRLRQIEIRLFLQAGEVIVINLEGVPGMSLTSPFEHLKSQLETLKVSGQSKDKN